MNLYTKNNAIGSLIDIASQDSRQVWRATLEQARLGLGGEVTATSGRATSRQTTSPPSSALSNLYRSTYDASTAKVNVHWGLRNEHVLQLFPSFSTMQHVKLNDSAQDQSHYSILSLRFSCYKLMTSYLTLDITTNGSVRPL
jgi:hypothetical protein